MFEVDLLKSQEINLDYILGLIFEQNKKNKNKGELIEEVRRLIRASLGNRAKESLIVDFINQSDLDQMADKASIIDAFLKFAQKVLAGRFRKAYGWNVSTTVIPNTKVWLHFCDLKTKPSMGF